MTEPDPGRKIGKGMLYIAWLGVLVLLTFTFGTWEESRLNPNKDPATAYLASGTREVTLSANRYHHYVASGTINGIEVVFLLDTGATDVVIPEKLADKIQLEKGPVRFAETANGTVETFATRISELTLGAIHLQNVRASINPHMEGDGVLLGMSALRQVEWIQQGDTLTLRQLPE